MLSYQLETGLLREISAYITNPIFIGISSRLPLPKASTRRYMEARIGAVWGAQMGQRKPIESIRGQRIEEIDR
jgi:hypothetical protein